MQLLTPVIAQIALMITITQDPSLGSIVKNYATLAFILEIDNMFASTFPTKVKELAQRLNNVGLLKFERDQNTL